MKPGVIGTQRRLVSMQRKNQQGRQVDEEKHVPCWSEQITSPATRSAVERAMSASREPSEDRTARIEALRAQVQGGSYRVDSASLARSMLSNTTHFLDKDVDT